MISRFRGVVGHRALVARANYALIDLRPLRAALSQKGETAE